MTCCCEYHWSFTSLQNIDQPDVPWAGGATDKLYLTSGQFTSTIKTSASLTITGSAAGIEWDGTNTPWDYQGSTIGVDKLMLQSGQFTSTLKTSLSVNAVDTDPNGIAWDGTNTPWCGSNGHKLYLQSGQFTSTLKTSQSVDTPRDISWDGVNTPWGDGSPAKLQLQSGQFTSTIKTSEAVSGVPVGMSWNLSDTLHSAGAKLILQSGQFTSTVKASQSTLGVDDNTQGVSSNRRPV